MASGIYIIEHSPSGRCYVGSGVNVANRFKSHRYQLRHGKHHSPRLQRAWNRDGEQAFLFRLVEEVAPDETLLLAREQFHIDERSAFKDGYNVAPVAGTRRGVRQPPSVAEKLRAVHAGKPKTPEQRAKMSAAAKGRPKSPEHRAKLAASVKRLMADPARREALRIAAKAQFADQASRDALSKRVKEAMARPEVRAKLRAPRKR